MVRGDALAEFIRGDTNGLVSFLIVRETGETDHNGIAHGFASKEHPTARPPTLRFPIAALYPVAFGAELWARFTGKAPFATVDGLRMARHHMFFNDAKARRELGYSSRPYREAVADAIAWFKQAGYLR